MKSSGYGLIAAIALFGHLSFASDEGLIDWWKAENNFSDFVGSGTGTSSAVTFTPGLSGNAFQFNGVNGAIYCGPTAGNFQDGDFTISFWIATQTTRADNIVGKRSICNNDSSWDIAMKNNTGKLHFQMSNDDTGNNWFSVDTARAINDGNFHHYACSRLGTNIYVYVDGALDATGSTAFPFNLYGTTDLSFGKSACTGIDGTSFFDGKLDDVKFYSRALPLEEITAIYDAFKDLLPPPPPPSPETTDVAHHWPGEGNANDEISGEHGTLNGDVSFAPGISGSAFLFGGVDGFINCGHRVGNFGTGDFTIAFWIQTPGTDSACMMGKRVVCDNDSSFDIAMFRDTGRINFQMNDEESHFSSFVTTKPVNDGLFHHWAVTRQGDLLSVYLDGVLDGTTITPVIYNIPADADLFIGKTVCVGFDDTRFFEGKLDEIRMYPRSLSNEEIGLLANRIAPGVYNGLFYENQTDSDSSASRQLRTTDGLLKMNSSGFIKVGATKRSTFSGKIMKAGGTSSFTGKFDRTGAAYVSVLQDNQLMSLVLQRKNADRLKGVLSNGSWSAKVIADRVAFSKGRPNSKAGDYTMALESDSNVGPDGESFGKINLSNLGAVRISGRFSDNTTLSQSAGISKAGRWPLYLSLYKGRGSAIGWLSFAENDANSIQGNVTWIKTDEFGKIYSAPFTNRSHVVGSTFSFGGSFRTNIADASAVLSGAGLQAPLIRDASVDATSISISDGNIRQSFKISASNGSFSGKLYNANKTSLQLRGIVLQQQTNGVGYFISTNQTGKVLLKPEN